MRIQTFSCAMVCLLAITGLGCSRNKEKAVSNVVSPENEAAFTNVAAQAVASFAIPSSDRRMSFRVAAIGEKLAAAAGKPYKTMLVMARPIQDAIPVPMDRVAITEELVMAAKSDDEVAAAIAHQMGHLSAGHPLEKLKKADLGQGKTGLKLLANWDPKQEDPLMRADLDQLAGRLWQVRYSPEEERTAEAKRIEIMTKAGYKPDAMGNLLVNMAKHADSTGRVPDYFTQHSQN